MENRLLDDRNKCINNMWDCGHEILPHQGYFETIIEDTEKNTILSSLPYDMIYKKIK